MKQNDKLNLTMLCDFYEITMGNGYFNCGYRDRITYLNDENILQAMTDLAEAGGVKNAKIMWPVRIAIAGKAVTPGGAVELARILGKDETLRRIRLGVEKLEATV